MLQREGRLSPLGEAIASYGRSFTTLHILAAATEESYRRDIKGLRNLHEERHGLAEKIFHGKKGELYQRYHRGMEAQLSGLGLIVNCVTLWNTRYTDAAINQLRAQGYPIREEDVARLSPFAHAHLNVTGTYSFVLPDLAGELRPLRDGEDNDPGALTGGRRRAGAVSRSAPPARRRRPLRPRGRRRRCLRGPSAGSSCVDCRTACSTDRRLKIVVTAGLVVCGCGRVRAHGAHRVGRDGGANRALLPARDP
jgi:Tn3 transposase DDE domain